MSCDKKCPAQGCQEKIELPGSGYNVGEVQRRTGWEPIMTHEGKILWLCPQHFEEANELAVKIAGLVGDVHIYFPSLLSKAHRTISRKGR